MFRRTYLRAVITCNMAMSKNFIIENNYIKISKGHTLFYKITDNIFTAYAFNCFICYKMKNV